MSSVVYRLPFIVWSFLASQTNTSTGLKKRSHVKVSLLNGRSLVSCGNVTIPANHQIPPVGTVVEVRYLYAYRDSLALYQPVYLGPRDDVDPGECVVSQLKFKAE